MESPSTEIERLLESITPQKQQELLQKLLELKKNHTSPTSPVNTLGSETNKRVLQSPTTPFRGQSRKIHSTKTSDSTNVAREVIVISDDSDTEIRQPTYLLPRRLDFSTTMSTQSKVILTSLQESSTSKSIDNLLGIHDLESSDDSDLSILEFAQDLAKQNEAVKALQLLSTSTSNSTAVNTNLFEQTSSHLTVNEMEYTNVQLSNEFADIEIIDVLPHHNSDSDAESESADSEANIKPTFAHLSPKEVEQMNLFPAYPKSNVEGYGSIVELPHQIASVEGVTKLRNALQYSLTKGAGKREKVVNFFQNEGPIKMNYHYRQCAGVKICEYMPDTLRGPHTQVDSENLEWARLLGAQEQAEAATHVGEIATIYEQWAYTKCDKYQIGGRECGGQPVIRSLNATSGSSIYTRLFIGCDKWTPRSRGHIFVSLSGYDPITVLQIWGRNRCFGVHEDFKQLMHEKWNDNVRSEDGIRPQCHAVYSNLQGGKDGKCPFFHSTGTNGTLQRGQIIQLSCNVKFHFFEPIFDLQGQPSIKRMAIISYGEHSHPPPPPRKIPALVRDQLIRAIREFGAAEATARRLVASPILPIMMNGATSLSQEHIAMTNQDAVNHLIRKERLKEYPWGTDFIGVQQMMTRQGLTDPYIRSTIQYPDGHFVVVCQFPEQSELFYQMYELQVDKTFSRTKCRELVVSGFDHGAKAISTLARVFTDYEDGEGYYQAFNLVFSQAEKDVGKRIPWGHLVSAKDSIVRIKAILVDEHGGQLKGLGRYFAKEYQNHDADWHILRIVRICRVHYERSIKKLEVKGVPEDLTKLLRQIPDLVVVDHYLNLLSKVRNEAEQRDLRILLNWLDHKDRNPWVLQCLTMATTKISREDWLSTSKNTNHGESDHASAAREGIKLSLISAVQKGRKFDLRKLQGRQNVNRSGVAHQYGNNSLSGRAQKKVTRSKVVKAKAKEKEKADETVIEGNELQIAQDLIRSGISPNIVEDYLVSKQLRRSTPH